MGKHKFDTRGVLLYCPYRDKISDLESQITKLKEKNKELLYDLQDEAMFGMKQTEQVAKLKEEIETYINAESKEINQLKSTLDEINALTEGSPQEDIFLYEKLKEIIAKHEDKA